MIDENLTFCASAHADEDSALDDLEAANQRRAALGYVTDAFAEALCAGIDGDCFANAALFAAFQQLVDTFGEEAVAVFAEGLPTRVRNGEYTVAVRQ